MYYGSVLFFLICARAPEFDMSELLSLFSADAPNSDNSVRDGKSNRCASGHKSEKVQLVISMLFFNRLTPIVSFLDILMEDLVGIPLYLLDKLLFTWSI